MLEVFAYKGYKKHKLRKQTAKEALDKKDEAFIRKSLDEHSPATTSTSPPSTNPFIRILHRKSTDGKKPEVKEGVDIPPTEAELAALKVNNSGISRQSVGWEVMWLGSNTPTSQEEDFARVLNSLNMAVSKVPPPPHPYCFTCQFRFLSLSWFVRS